jgi:hypothetical protein
MGRMAGYVGQGDVKGWVCYGGWYVEWGSDGMGDSVGFGTAQ